METRISFLNRIVAAVITVLLFSAPLAAQETPQRVSLDDLFARLAEAERDDARRLAKEIELEFSKSGSSSADLLLKRGRDALEGGDTRKAIEHLTAVVDHAPDFAEGWHMRAVAYAQAELFGPAIADLERALAIEPRHFYAIASLGGLMAQINRPRMARDAFEQVLAIHPHFDDVSAAMEQVDRQIGGSEL